MTWIMVDVEADGPCPGLYSMVSFGAVVVEPKLERSFYGMVLSGLAFSLCSVRPNRLIAYLSQRPDY